MDPLDLERLTDGECVALFRRLFPRGLAGADVLAEIAPESWEHSPLAAAFHPSVEQVYREALRFHRNAARLARGEPQQSPRPEPTLDEIRRTWRDEPGDRDREVRELVGRCLWDVFSDNHEVSAADGRVVDIGSFRGTGGFIADLLSGEAGTREYDYADFYMGTFWIADRADLTPAFTAIFRRLAAHGCDWTYTFPQIYLFDFRDLDALPLGERLERERQRAEMDTTIEEGHREALEAAKDRPPPPPVEAYRRVFGQWPRGWPPWE